MLYAGPQPDVILLTILIAFLPSITLVILLRYTERYEREPWGSLWTAFLWGATASVILVILARGYFTVYMKDHYPIVAANSFLMKMYTIGIITPLVAEIIKLGGLFFVRDELNESEDGLIYGAVIGLGFAATETLLYGLFVFSTYGIKIFIHTVLLRTVSVFILQASVGAIAGYGISRAIAKKHKKGSLLFSPVFLLVAMLCHSVFNLIANATATESGVNISYTYALAFSITFSAITWIVMWVKIIRLDRMDKKDEKDEKGKKERRSLPSKEKFSMGDRGRETGSSRELERDFGMLRGDRRRPFPAPRPPPSSRSGGRGGEGLDFMDDEWGETGGGDELHRDVREDDRYEYPEDREYYSEELRDEAYQDGYEDGYGEPYEDEYYYGRDEEDPGRDSGVDLEFFDDEDRYEEDLSWD